MFNGDGDSTILKSPPVSSRTNDNDEYASHKSLPVSPKRTSLPVESERNARMDKVMEELTINKLNIKSLGLVGRDEEKLILESCFQRLCPLIDGAGLPEQPNKGVENELVFIMGYSGIGKSALARTLHNDIGASGVYVEGKYEFTSADEPYSGVAQAFGILCNEFKDCDEDTVTRISSTIEESMREETLMLTSLIPEISVFLDKDLDTTTIHGGSVSARQEHERWSLKSSGRTLLQLSWC